MPPPDPKAKKSAATSITERDLLITVTIPTYFAILDDVQTHRSIRGKLSKSDTSFRRSETPTKRESESAKLSSSLSPSTIYVKEEPLEDYDTCISSDIHQTTGSLSAVESSDSDTFTNSVPLQSTTTFLHYRTGGSFVRESSPESRRGPSTRYSSYHPRSPAPISTPTSPASSTTPKQKRQIQERSPEDQLETQAHGERKLTKGPATSVSISLPSDLRSR